MPRCILTISITSAKLFSPFSPSSSSLFPLDCCWQPQSSAVGGGGGADLIIDFFKSAKFIYHGNVKKRKKKNFIIKFADWFIEMNAE